MGDIICCPRSLHSNADFKDVKACLQNPILKIQLLVPKIGKRRSDGPISSFHVFVMIMSKVICGVFTRSDFQNWQRTFNLAPKRSQEYHAEFIGVFHLSRRVLDENRACPISIRFFRITDPCIGRSFSMCSHDPIFETNENWFLKNGSCERALTAVWANAFQMGQSHRNLGFDLFLQWLLTKISRMTNGVCEWRTTSPTILLSIIECSWLQHEISVRI